MKRAFLFPGQGAQFVGMGKDIYEKYPAAKEIFDNAEKITGIQVKKICFEGPEEELLKTKNTQIAILTTSLAILEVLKQKGITADVSLGLSLGEYGALIYSEIISFEDGMKLIKKRGEYMGSLVPKAEYAMAAVIGADTGLIEKVCSKIREEGNFVVPANYNCKTQTVISGQAIAVDIAIEKLKKAGVRKIIKLKTGGPFHTEKLSEAKKEYEKELEKITFGNPTSKVVKNLDGTIYTSQDNIKEILANHIISPVRLDKAIEYMEKQNIDEYIEIGPGKALTGFVKKDIKEASTFNISSVETLEAYLNKGEI